MKKLLTVNFMLIFSLVASSYSFSSENKKLRVVSLAPSTTEILFELGMGDFIVGVDEYSDFPKATKDIECVGTFISPNIEKIILLRPDYILINADIEPGEADYLEAQGAQIVKVSPDTVHELCEDIESLGVLFDKKYEAAYVVREIKKSITDAASNLKGHRPRVFVQLFDDPLITGSSFIGDVVRLAGGDNIAWDVKDDAGLFSFELLIERDPDIVVAVGFSGESMPVSSIAAVKTNRIYKDLDPDVLLRPGPRIKDAIRELNRIFYEKD